MPEAKLIKFVSEPKKEKPERKHSSGLIPLHFRYSDPITKQPKQKVVYGKTETEAKKKKAAFLRQVENGLRMAEQGKTVGQWAQDWLDVYKRPKVKKAH